MMCISAKTIIFCSFISLQMNAKAQIRLPKFVRDSMVLQRNAPIPIRGWASKNEKIEIRFQNKNYKTIADEHGNWKLSLAAMPAGGPYTMYLQGKNKLLLKDILIGDVWVASGQSNMEHQLRLHADYYAKEIAAANYPMIRQFKVPNTIDLQRPQQDLSAGNWKWANLENVLDFSAVAYFFALSIYEKQKVPIGIINATWGGSPIEAWMSEKSLQKFSSIEAILQKNKDSLYVATRNATAQKVASAIVQPKDIGLEEKWYAENYAMKGNGWRSFALPGYWEDQGCPDLDGTVWFRKEITIEKNADLTKARLLLGRIVDADVVYINGQRIGQTGYLYPQRRYAIPQNILHTGKNTLAISVTNNSGKGGFVPDKPYYLLLGKDSISLAGYWQYKVGAVFPPVTSTVAPALTLQYQPSALFNSMLAPWIGYGIKGFIWYQGESNMGDAATYEQLQPAMIQDWRDQWKLGDIPFLFVQLPGFMSYHYLPMESNIAKFREAQAKSLSLPRTGMAVAIDVGEWNDIHPDRKKPIGDRLAAIAAHLTVDQNIVYSGPALHHTQMFDSSIIIDFDYIGQGLITSDGNSPAAFAVAGDDKKFYWAKAIIKDNKIWLSSTSVPHPKYVRYAWADMPVNPNLYNKEGFPAAPFRTDK